MNEKPGMYTCFREMAKVAWMILVCYMVISAVVAVLYGIAKAVL